MNAQRVRALGVSMAAFVMFATLDRVPADRRWELMMVEGHYGGVWLQRNQETPPPRPDDRIQSQVQRAQWTKYGITVQDKAKDSLFGLVPGESWWLAGGLLGRVDLPGESVELFGKTATKERGTADLRKDMWADFYLVRRPRGGPGSILRKWTFNPGEIVVTFRPGNPAGGIEIPEYTVGGTLRYDEGAREIEVTFQGLTRPVVERVSLTDGPPRASLEPRPPRP